MNRIELSATQRQEIQSVAGQLKAGTFKREGHRTGIDSLRMQLYRAQLALIGWKPYPPRQRGYIMQPDCAKALLLECRAIRQVFRTAGIPLVPLRD